MNDYVDEKILDEIFMEKSIRELNYILVEYGFQARWVEIEKWWNVGKVLTENDINSVSLSKIADELEIDEGELWDAILFYKKFPSLDLLPEGKDVSWSKIKEKYL
jgi:hypothetical protein